MRQTPRTPVSVPNAPNWPSGQSTCSPFTVWAMDSATTTGLTRPRECGAGRAAVAERSIGAASERGGQRLSFASDRYEPLLSPSQSLDRSAMFPATGAKWPRRLHAPQGCNLRDLRAMFEGLVAQCNLRTGSCCRQRTILLFYNESVMRVVSTEMRPSNCAAVSQISSRFGSSRQPQAACPNPFFVQQTKVYLLSL